MQAGTQQVAAGYVLYGPSTMLVLTVGAGVVFFTFNPDSREFVLTAENIQVAADTGNLLSMPQISATGKNRLSVILMNCWLEKLLHALKTLICAGLPVWLAIFIVFSAVAGFSFIHMI